MEPIPVSGASTKPAKSKSQWPIYAGVLALVAALSFTAGTRAQDIPGYNKLFNGAAAAGPATIDLSSVERTYSVLRSQYDGQIDVNKLVEGANRGLVEAAGDPYTAYFNAKEAASFDNDLEGRFSGIGAELSKKDNNISVLSTIDGSPAQKADLQKNDIIAKVNDQDTSGWAIDKAVNMIRGEKGTTVKLTIVRGNEVKNLSIVRDDIVNPSVKSEVTADNIGVMRISRFSQSETFQLAEHAADDFKSKKVKGIVVDLRGNGGGYLNAAQDIASLWLRNKVVVTERHDGKIIPNGTLRSGNDPVLEGIPTVVLVDGGSASASEILAGALHDNGAAKLVGQKTFGKGSVQTIKPVDNGAEVKVTVAKWYTPNGININKEGIKPDIEVGITPDDVTAGRDPQLDRAKQEAAR